MTEWLARVIVNSELDEQPAAAGAESFSMADAFVSLYGQLRAIARARLMHNPAVATLQATSVVNEALLRLMRSPPGRIADEGHLLAVASQCIRQVIVDHARRKRVRRGTPTGTGLPTDGAADPELAAAVDRVTPVERAALLMDLDAAMDALSGVDAELRTIVELHCYAGLNHAEVAALLQLSERTVRRRWTFATAQLRTHLADWDQPRVHAADLG